MIELIRLARSRLSSESAYREFQRFIAAGLRHELEAKQVQFEGKAVIELGSGHGGYSDVFSAQTSHYLATDLSFYAGPHGYDKVQLDLANSLPIRDCSFDLAICCNVIEHLEDSQICLREIRRIIKPGGTLVLTFPPFYSILMAGGHHFKPFHFLGEPAAVWIYNKLHRTHIANYKTSFGAFGLYPLTIASVRRQILSAGLTIVQEFTRMSAVNTMQLPSIAADLFTGHACFVARKI